MITIGIDYLEHGIYIAFNMESGEVIASGWNPEQMVGELAFFGPVNAKITMSPGCCLMNSFNYGVDCWRHDHWMQKFGMFTSYAK